MLNSSRRKLLSSASAQLAASPQSLQAVIAATPWNTRSDLVPEAQSLLSIVNQVGTNEAEFYYRDRMPETFDYDWPNIITNASGGAINGVKLETQYRGVQVAIIGAGAAGLCAGYEMMKLGLQPVFYEMQLDPDNAGFVRPQGRGYSWDFTCNDVDNDTTKKGGYTSWYPTSVSGPAPNAANQSPFYGGRQFADLGAMRYPESHVALHTYVDEIFTGDYYYGADAFSGEITPTQWPEWRDPGLFESTSSNANPYGKPANGDTLVFPTVIYTTGIADPSDLSTSYRGFYRMDPGLTLGNANTAVNNLTFKNWNLLFGPNGNGPDGGTGYLRKIVRHYINYTEAAAINDEPLMQQLEQKIKDEWSDLNDRFQGQSLYEVLEQNGWTEEPAYPTGFETNPANSTLLEMFGEIGIGSGGFDVFWWTTFMETLRIRLHLDETSQDAFVGGTSYMISPFLTHNATLYDNSTKNLWTATAKTVISDPVVAITPRGDDEGVVITTRASDGTTDQKAYIACILTAAPSAIRSRIDIDNSLITNQGFRALQRLRLTNSGKVAINFPGVGGYGDAFWMNRNASTPNDPSDDMIVTTITDKNIRSIYTFDNYNWGTASSSSNVDLLKSGSLMLSYSWDMNSDAFTPLSVEDQVQRAWDQMIDIYSDSANSQHPLPSDVDSYLDWAMTNNQYQAVVWTDVDGFAGGYRMAGLGLNQKIDAIGTIGGQAELWASCQTSLNRDTGQLTGLFPAGEAIAWLGLSGWIEGAIQTGLVATIGVVNYLNQLPAGANIPSHNLNGKSFSLPLLPGDTQFPPTN